MLVGSLEILKLFKYKGFVARRSSDDYRKFATPASSVMSVSLSPRKPRTKDI